MNTQTHLLDRFDLDDTINDEAVAAIRGLEAVITRLEVLERVILKMGTDSVHDDALTTVQTAIDSLGLNRLRLKRDLG